MVCCILCNQFATLHDILRSWLVVIWVDFWFFIIYHCLCSYFVINWWVYFEWVVYAHERYLMFSYKASIATLKGAWSTAHCTAWRKTALRGSDRWLRQLNAFYSCIPEMCWAKWSNFYFSDSGKMQWPILQCGKPLHHWRDAFNSSFKFAWSRNKVNVKIWVCACLICKFILKFLSVTNAD